jgi:hypothetical protein
MKVLKEKLKHFSQISRISQIGLNQKTIAPRGNAYLEYYSYRVVGFSQPYRIKLYDILITFLNVHKYFFT